MEFLMQDEHRNQFKELFRRQRQETGVICGRQSDRDAFISLFYRRVHIYVQFENSFDLTKYEILAFAFDLVLNNQKATADTLGISLETLRQYEKRAKEKLTSYSKKICFVRLAQASIIKIF